jgi:orotate phosphoribosyltransferase
MEQGRTRGDEPVVTGWALPGKARSVARPESTVLTKLRDELIAVVRSRGLMEVKEPLQLASGDWSRFFVDGKAALARGADLHNAAVALLELVAEERLEFDAVGGLTMGADQFAHAVAMVRPDVEWFSVRKAPKDRGTRRRIEGSRLGADSHVLLVDDVVTRGGSIVEAYEQIVETGATVVCAVTLVDRGAANSTAFFTERGIPYRALVTHEDLGIPAVGTEPGLTSATGCRGLVDLGRGDRRRSVLRLVETSPNGR